MSYEKIKEYLSMALDMEKNIYIQEKVISNLDHEINSLGYGKNYSKPKKTQADVAFSKYIFVPALCLCFIGYIIQMVGEIESSNGFFDGIFAFFRAINWNLLWWAIGGAILGLVIASIKYAVEQSEYNAIYNQKLRDYERAITEDSDRVKKEKAKKQDLISQRCSLFDKYEESCDNLDKFYSYNLIEEKYRNLVAIATIYQYFEEKRTFSLGFDPKTGDQGAYNIYNTERRQDIISDKLDVIADKLDTVIENQMMIANTLHDANRRIESLSSSINSGMRKIEGAINNQTAVISYNDERKLAEQKYLSNIATWNYMDRQMGNR